MFYEKNDCMYEDYDEQYGREEYEPLVCDIDGGESFYEYAKDFYDTYEDELFECGFNLFANYSLDVNKFVDKNFSSFSSGFML